MFSLAHKKESVSLLLDIGNGNVSAGLVVCTPDALPRLIYSTTSPILVGKDRDADLLSTAMISQLNNTLTDIMKTGFMFDYWKGKDKKIDAVTVSVSTPWFVSASKHIHITQPKPFFVTERFISDVVDAEQKSFEQELGITDDHSNNHLSPLEHAITHTRINGYVLDDSIGKKTSQFDMLVYISETPTTLLQDIYKTIFAHTHIAHDAIYTHSFPFVCYSALQVVMPFMADYLIMDVTGEVTDITWVSNGSITKTSSFPSGRGFVLRHIAQTFSVSPEIAESLLHMYIGGMSDDSVNESMKTVFTEIHREWSVYIDDALTGLSSTMSLPSKVFVTADHDISQLCVDFLKTLQQDTTQSFKKHIDPVYVDDKLFSRHFTYNPHLPANEFLALLAIFHNKQYAHK